MAKIKPLTGKAGDFSGIVLKAAARGDLKAVRQYLKVTPAWLNQEGPHGRTMLWEAAYKGRTELVAELIRLGADVNPLGSYYTPMLVELSALAVARNAGREELAQLLVEHGATDDLYAACYRGDLEAINQFLSQDADAVNRPARETEPHPRMGYHPIHYAVAGQQPGACKLLIGAGAEVAEHVPLLLDWADGHREVIALIKKFGGAPKSGARSSKQATARGGKAVPAIDRPDWMGFPLLVDACRGNHNAPDEPERVKKLLKRGANINIRDHKQKTPLHRSCQAGFRKITTLLLENGADMELADQNGQTPIFDAALHGRTDAAMLLVEQGVNLAHLDNRGECVLFAAARGGHPETFSALLEAGADPHVENARGKDLGQYLASTRSKTPGRQAIQRMLGK